jgi:two-component system cell cycle sensor histidine kinase/response regulator CckA
MGQHRVPAVLVVDDSEAIREVTRRALEAEGYQVWEAGNGIEAVAWLTRGVVDVVVTDIRMPEMDGWQLAAYLKSLSPAPPVLFISGYDAHLGSRNLPGPVLAKPFRAEQLVTSVRQLLMGSQPQSA